MKHKFLKKMLALTLSSLLTFQFLSANTFAVISNDTLLYEDKEVQTIAGGVTYEKSSRLYKDGWLDVYVLTVDTTNENIELDVIKSASELGLKKSVEAFAKENNAIAAVNGDFFNSGNPKSSMGQIFSEGKIEEAQSYYNSYPKFAGVFVDTSGNAFVDYLKTQYRLYNSPTNAMEIYAKNKYTDFENPVYIDRSAMKDTSAVDKRISGLIKLVVEKNILTKISAAGELVTVPENGYIIIMKNNAAQEKLKTFSVGQQVTFSETASLVFRPNKNLSKIKMGISGGGEILRNGSICANGLIVGKNERNPRTVLGVTKDKKKLIIMTIDGRRNGLGTTHNETANILLEYGAYDAIHLDGGGSTTMVVKKDGASDLSVVNVPSEGSQRSVANALGIKTLNKTSDVVTKADLLIAEKTLMKNATATISLKCYNEYQNPINADINNFTFKVTAGNGVIEGNRITPSESGNIEITAYMNETPVGVLKTSVSEPVKLNVHSDSSFLEIGESAALKTSYVDKDGREAYYTDSDIEWTVENPETGYIENNSFVAVSNGAAKLTAKKGNFTGTLTLSVGSTEKTVENFENDKDLRFLVYPNNAGITGGCGKTNADKWQGANSYILNYNFQPGKTVTQAAYMSFENQPIQLGNAKKINMWVKGDGKGCLLKGMVRDGNNTVHQVSFTDSINFTDWRNLTASIPADAAAPLKLEKLYVASLQTTGAINGSIFVDDLRASVPMYETSSSSSDNSFDYLKTSVDGAPGAGEEDITVFGQTAKQYGDNMPSVMNNVVRSMAQYARAMYFVGDTNVNTSAYNNIVSIRWNNKYSTTNTNNLSIINIATGSNACIRTANYDQWRWFKSYLYNFSKNNIVIGIDKDIWGRNGSNLTDSRERTLFHKILKDFVNETGKNVVVVAATGYNTDVLVKDGIRYITLNGASAANSYDLKNFKYLRLRVSSDNLKYDIKNVY